MLLMDLHSETVSNQNAVSNELQRSELAMKTVQMHANEMSDFYLTDVVPLLHSIKQYKNKEKEKSDLLSLYTNNFNKIAEFDIAYQKLATARKEVYASLLNLGNNLKELHLALFTHNMNYITNDNYMETNLGKLLLQHNSSSKYTLYFRNFSTNFEDMYIRLLELHTYDTVNAMDDLIADVIVEAERMIESMKYWNENMVTFQHQIQLSTQFYM